MDVAEIKEAVTDGLKKIQKEEFLAVFTNCKTAQKPVYMPMRLILIKMCVYIYIYLCVFFMCLQFKKSFFKLLGRTVYVKLLLGQFL